MASLHEMIRNLQTQTPAAPHPSAPRQSMFDEMLQSSANLPQNQPTPQSLPQEQMVQNALAQPPTNLGMAYSGAQRLDNPNARGRVSKQDQQQFQQNQLAQRQPPGNAYGKGGRPSPQQQSLGAGVGQAGMYNSLGSQQRAVQPQQYGGRMGAGSMGGYTQPQQQQGGKGGQRSPQVNMSNQMGQMFGGMQQPQVQPQQRTQGGGKGGGYQQQPAPPPSQGGKGGGYQRPQSRTSYGGGKGG